MPTSLGLLKVVSSLRSRVLYILLLITLCNNVTIKIDITIWTSYISTSNAVCWILMFIYLLPTLYLAELHHICGMN